MRFVGQEFKKIDPPLLLRQVSGQQTVSTAPSNKHRLLHVKYILGNHAGMVGGEGFEPPTYSV
jgi:hypothetical protein